ncbi:MAG: helix-turn-helix transcriptional regulator [Raoultibacter sp.]
MISVCSLARGKIDKQRRERHGIRHAWFSVIALIAVFAEYWLLNYSAFPLFDPISIVTREISAAAGGCVLVLLALVAAWKPSVFKERLFFIGVPIVLIVGLALMGIGLSLQASFLLILGVSCITIAIGLIAVVVGIGCIGMPSRTLGLCVIVAYFLSYALRGVFQFLPTTLNMIFFALIPLVALALSTSYARPVLAEIFLAEPPVRAVITTPNSLLPFEHQIFIVLIVFRFVYGYTLTFGETERVPFLSFFALIPLGMLVIYAIFRRRPLDLDGLFRMSILFSIAGFLVLSLSGGPHDIIASNLLSCGTGFFEILMYISLVALGSKNKQGSLVVLTWGNAMASLGTIVGANFGRLTNAYYGSDSIALSVISATIIFCLVFYVLVIQKDFSFMKTVQSIAPLAPVVFSTHLASPETQCIVLSERYGLTPRESEILMLLARGRNTRFIQDKLVVSYNTVKTHVSHIYAKLDVHTHQELINVVEEQLPH